MRRILSRLATVAGLVAALAVLSPAFAQLTVTDGGRTSTTCTTYTVTYSAATPNTPVITLSPANCMSGDPPPPAGPYFRFSTPNATSGEADAVAAGGAFNITYTVELVRNGNANPLAVTVEACRAGTNCTALPGQDFYLEAGFSWTAPYAITLNFAPGETAKTFVIAAADDAIADGNKLLTLTLLNPTSPAVVGSPTTHLLTLTDNEPAPSASVNFTATAPTMYENTAGGGLGFIGISRSAGTGTASILVDVLPSSTAVLGTNYALDVPDTPFSGSPPSYTLNFADGETNKGIFVRAIDVTGYFGHKQVDFRLSNPVNLLLGSATTSSLTIFDKDLPPPDGTDKDINGNVIPDSPLAITNPQTPQCEYPVGTSGSPGPNPSNPCGAYRIKVEEPGSYNCSSGMSGGNAINNAYLLQIENYTPTSFRIGNGMWWGMSADSVMIYKFKTGSASVFPAMPYPFGLSLEEQTSHGANTPRFVSISERKCDFDYSKLYPLSTEPDWCYQSQPVAIPLQARISTIANDPNIPAPYCRLKADTTYYLNIRFENAGTLSGRGVRGCIPNPGQTTCGTTMQIF